MTLKQEFKQLILDASRQADTDENIRRRMRTLSVKAESEKGEEADAIAQTLNVARRYVCDNPTEIRLILAYFKDISDCRFEDAATRLDAIDQARVDDLMKEVLSSQM